MAKSLRIANDVMQQIVQLVPRQTLSRTSYCAMVVKLQNGNRAVLVAEAGATARGIGGPLLDNLQRAVPVAIFGCASPTAGQGTWHMNDAEQQALRIFSQQEGALRGATIRAVVANRDICSSCTYTLQGQGLTVDGAEAYVP